MMLFAARVRSLSLRQKSSGPRVRLNLCSSLLHMTFIIATRNAHKVEEIRGILGNQFAFLTLRDFPNAPAVIEDSPTFAGNATKKAVELARWLSSQPATFN